MYMQGWNKKGPRMHTIEGGERTPPELTAVEGKVHTLLESKLPHKDLESAVVIFALLQHILPLLQDQPHAYMTGR